MTPFDGSTLLAVLTAFSPVVSAATLAQARADRPWAFSNGALVGDGTVLQLADGRQFDLICAGAWCVVGHSSDPNVAGVWDAARIRAFFLRYVPAVGDGTVQQWLAYWTAWGWKDPGYFVYRMSHAQELVDAGIATPIPADPGGDPFALEPGPLTPVDEGATWFPPSDPTQFEALVSDHLGALDGSAAQLDAVHAGVTAFDTAGASANLDDGTVEGAQAAHAAGQTATGAETIDDLAGATEGQNTTIPGTRAGYDVQPPPSQPAPDPGDSPDPGHGYKPGEPPSI